ncbi:hypothetical protein ACTXNW_08660 [Enterococcus malodoratus]|uniref:hypothetical protein n=1 Tax=Enterococcus malodoratus TaxID=71451 RepID=UPI003FD1C003
MNKGSKYKSGQRPTFRIWDNEKNDWFEPTYEGWDGKIEELLLSPTGDLAMRTFTDFKRESIFPERFEIVLDEPQKVRAKLAKHWHEDVGDCLWWNFPVEEPPYCGTPLDEHFPKYKTHFTTIDMPNEIEQPKRWVVMQGGSEAWYLQGFRNSLDGDIVKQWCSYEGCIKFTDRKKAEAVATFVDGSVEEV